MTDSLSNVSPKNSFGDLLHVSNGNAGVDETLRTVYDGIGNATALQISETGAKVNGDLEVTGSLVGSTTLSDEAPQPVGVANAGLSISAARGDHVHAHGDQSGGSLHALATAGVAGFMPADDKSKLDGIAAGADVTNTASVGAAGAVMDGDFAANGLMERTGVGAYAVRSIGVSSSSSIPTRADADARYLQAGSSIDASAVTSGVFDIARIPAAALERLVVVADQTARYALTTASVQVGDTVKQVDTGVMYMVVDTANLANSAGYQVYAAGSAASVPWSGVTSKPTTVSGYGITDALALTSSAPAALGATAVVGSATAAAKADHVHQRQLESIIVACGDETTAITAGTAKVTFRMPYAFTVTAVYAELVTAQTSGSIFTVDINEAGTSILSTKLTIDNTETDSATAATAAVISDTALAARALITVDVDQIGDGTAKGLKVTLIGRQSA